MNYRLRKGGSRQKKETLNGESSDCWGVGEETLAPAQCFLLKGGRTKLQPPS